MMMTSHSPEGDYHRFDSLRALLTFCRHRYQTEDVTAVREDDELRVRIVLADGSVLRRLVVHFEGARVFVVRLV